MRCPWLKKGMSYHNAPSKNELLSFSKRGMENHTENAKQRPVTERELEVSVRLPLVL